MGLLLDAARAWDALTNVRYTLDVAKRGKMKRIELCFSSQDFPHIAGMQYAKDVDFGPRRAEIYGQKLIPALLTQKIDGSKIETAQKWSQISGRLTAIIHLQSILDGDFILAAFNRAKVRGYSKIEAEFVLQSCISGEIYFIFLDADSGRYYCKSAFQKDSVDYMEYQSKMTLLRKSKTVGGETSVLYIREGYSPEG